MEFSKHTIIFDLDGTIYQNFDIQNYYIPKMVRRTKYEIWENELIELVERITNGEILKMNHFYRNEKKEINSIKELEECLAEQRLAGISYEEALKRKNIIYLGDIWAVLSFIGKALGCLEGNRSDMIYYETRREMEKAGVNGDFKLAKSIVSLQERCFVILISNSYKATVDEFLLQLGYENIFKRICYSGQKPYNMIEDIRSINPEILINPEKITSIGDHAFNDLMPIDLIGGKTVWMNPYKKIDRPRYDLTFSALDELADYLDTL